MGLNGNTGEDIDSLQHVLPSNGDNDNENNK